MPMGDVVLKQVAPQTVAAIREVIPTHSTVERLFLRWKRLWHSTISRSLELHSIFGTIPNTASMDVDAEVGLPVEGMAQSKGNVAVRQLPGIELAACMIHQGSYDTIGQSYATMLK